LADEELGLQSFGCGSKLKENITWKTDSLCSMPDWVIATKITVMKFKFSIRIC